MREKKRKEEEKGQGCEKGRAAGEPRRHDWRGIHNNLIAMHKATFIESAIYLTIIPRARMGCESIAP